LQEQKEKEEKTLLAEVQRFEQQEAAKKAHENETEMKRQAKWTTELGQLGDMGFTDRPSLTTLLEKWNGDVQHVVQHLLE